MKRVSVAVLALLAAGCLKRQEPPPFVDPGPNTHNSDQVGDSIEYGRTPERANGESAGGYTGGGRIGSDTESGNTAGAGAGQSIDEVDTTGGNTGTPSSFTGTTGSGTVLLVRNDIVKGRAEALTAALKDAFVKKAAADGVPSVPADLVAKFRKYVARYKIIREGATDDGNYKLDLEADIDTSLLRTDIGARQGGGPVGQTIELHIANAKRARDLRAIAAVLRDDTRVKEVRQQSFGRNQAVLEVDTTAISAEIAELVATTVCEDGVTVSVDGVNEKSIKTTIVFPKAEH